MLWFLLVVAGTVPVEQVAREQVDLVELNHFFDDQGRHIFDQLVFYDWSSADGRHQVRAWRLLKSAEQRPTRCWEKGGLYRSLWQDGEIFRSVYARDFQESWTQYDPELVDREFLPKECRRDLFQPFNRHRFR